MARYFKEFVLAQSFVSKPLVNSGHPLSLLQPRILKLELIGACPRPLATRPLFVKRSEFSEASWPFFPGPTVKARSRLPLGSRLLSDIPISDFLLISGIDERDVASKDDRYLQQLDVAEYKNMEDSTIYFKLHNERKEEPRRLLTYSLCTSKVNSRLYQFPVLFARVYQPPLYWGVVHWKH